MSNQTAHSGGRSKCLVAAIVIVVVVVSSTVFAASYLGKATTTVSSAAGSLLPVTLYRANGDWNFTVSLNRTAVTRGQDIAAVLNLTNVSGQTQSVVIASPLSNPALYTLSGKQVWAWERSATNAVQQISEGQTLSYPISIPTSELQTGETYVLTSSPNILTATNPEVSFGKDLQVNATITVA